MVTEPHWQRCCWSFLRFTVPLKWSPLFKSGFSLLYVFLCERQGCFVSFVLANVYLAWFSATFTGAKRCKSTIEERVQEKAMLCCLKWPRHDCVIIISVFSSLKSIHSIQGTSKRRRVTDERELRIPLEYGYVKEFFVIVLRFGSWFCEVCLHSIMPLKQARS